MTSWARVDAEPKKEDPKWDHVNKPEEKDQFAALAERINKAYEKCENSRDFSMFDSDYSAKEYAQFLYAYTGMQKCMGNISDVALDSFKGNGIRYYSVDRSMGMMLFYIQVMLDSLGGDLTNIRDECIKTCEAAERL